jgi:hypothetical protein
MKTLSNRGGKVMDGRPKMCIHEKEVKNERIPLMQWLLSIFEASQIDVDNDFNVQKYY